jgi:hypothetical protein
METVLGLTVSINMNKNLELTFKVEVSEIKIISIFFVTAEAFLLLFLKKINIDRVLGS